MKRKPVGEEQVLGKPIERITILDSGRPTRVMLYEMRA